jgi:lysyl endopeptidase
MFRRLPFVLFLCLAASPAAATEIPSVLLPDAPEKAAAPRALHLAETASLQPLAVLRPAKEGAADQLEAIAAWNRSRGVPAKNGFARPLPLPKSVRFTAELLKSQPSRLAGGALLAPPSGGLVWAAEARAEGGYRLRLHLSQVSLPKGTRLWVYGEGTDEEVSVDAADVTYAGELWTPSVAGPAIRLEVRLPEKGLDGARFTVDQVLETFELDSEGAPQVIAQPQPKANDTSCIQDAACYGTAQLASMDIQKKAAACLEFVVGGQGYLCSGALLNDTDETTTIPYLLTAHHCFDSQSSASSLEAFFDYIATSCHGSVPSLGSVPRTVGATLLATGEGSDFTFVRLTSLPSGRGLLGSTNEPVAAGTVLHRLSHPLGQPLRYSRAEMEPGVYSCSDVPRPRFVYSYNNLGGTFGGSSGSALTRGSDGRLVGQLLGSCGFNPAAGCDINNDDVDGALAVTWPSISSWLTPAVVDPGTCKPDLNTLCLKGNRFKVQATYEALDGQAGPAKVVQLTDETGYLWFFADTNVEVVLKVLDACSYVQKYWVFAGGLTDVHVVITVTDTKTTTVKTYTNPQKTKFLPVQDTSAFATCP